ncbi:MAG: phosphodiester glycosidase family protein [Lachnospiraceae bacterium]|nr:phosphodiester glycosidase family protein [Lachnospiraceae bacterium]
MGKLNQKLNIGFLVLKIFGFIMTFVAVLFLVLYILCGMACSSKRPNAQRTFVTTMLETGKLKFVVSWYLSEEEINSIVASNSMGELNEEVDESLINIKSGDKVYEEHVNEVDAGNVTDNREYVENNEKIEDPDGDGIDVFEVIGRSFRGKMMVVYDPSRLSVSAKYPWGKTGQELHKFVINAGSVAGINGGLYEEGGNTGGKPYGVVVSNGEILRNKPKEKKGLVLIGFTEDNILIVENLFDDDLNSFSEKQVEELIERKKIRDAVCFQEEASDKNNHFVQLIINGEKREMNGMGSGLNPRTAIGQRADGALLLLVTDGRGASGHIGASASDLIEVMEEYGAVNAANLDGGSSSCMYYNGEYLMNSVTFYYANSSWNMPLALIVK